MTLAVRRTSPWDRPLDVILVRLRSHGLIARGDSERLDTWHAPCPVCRESGDTLAVVERRVGGETSLRCRSGCHSDKIAAALAEQPSVGLPELPWQVIADSVQVELARRDRREAILKERLAAADLVIECFLKDAA